MESNNLFSHMNSDMSNLTPSNGRYIKATNFRPITEYGSSNNALTNIKGNNCELTFPRVRGVYKLKLNHTTGGVITVTVNGLTTTSITISSGTTTESIAAYIQALSNCYNGVYAPIYTFAVAYDDNYIFIYQQPEYKQCSSTASIEPTISITQSSGSSRLVFVDVNNNSNNNQVPYIPAEVNDKIVVIGSTYINETNYLFTCNKTNPNGTGQIWSLYYNEVTQQTTAKLLYNSYLNFSINYPIPPTAANGRYENDSIQRIYWSDNNNPIRTLNVAADNLMVLDYELTNLRPSSRMNIPVLSKIRDNDASIPLPSDATYQCSYRLVKNNGALTNYSAPSHIVNLTPQPIERFNCDLGNFCSLSGTGQNVNKSIEWTVENVDTNYDFIEFVVIKRVYPEEEVFSILQFDRIAINGASTIKAKYVNTGEELEISTNEFLIENTTFTHCKTIGEKDNRLFFGNVSSKLIEYLDTFDTRVYRFNASTNLATGFRIKTYEANNGTQNYTSYSAVPSEADAIAPYNLGMSVDDHVDYLEHKYQAYNGSYNVVGGTGLNISYKFGSCLIESDETPYNPSYNPSDLTATNKGTNRDSGVNNLLYQNGYRKAGLYLSNIGIIAPYQTYITDCKRTSIGLDYFNGLLRTGQHNEIYRYGILFKSKSNESNFVKWIGDIKFPDYSDSVAPGLEGRAYDGTNCTDFRSMYFSGGRAYCNLPYIEFTVNIPEELAVLIDSFEIVRVKRNTDDRTIVSQGLITQTQRASASNITWMPKSHHEMYSTLDSLRNTYMAPRVTNGNNGASNRVILYQSFKALADGNTLDFAEDDKIVVREKYTANVNSAIWPIGTAPGTNFTGYFYVTKFYDRGAGYNNTTYNVGYKIKEAQYVTQNQSVSFSSGNYYHNMDFIGTFSSSPRDTSAACAEGNATVVIDLQTSNTLNWADFNAGGSNVAASPGNDDNAKLLAIHFRPRMLSTQYGGRTYNARANNEYITTGAFYSVESSGYKTIKCFGGDVFHGILDVQRAIKGAYYSPSGTYPSAGNAYRTHSQTWFFPTQSVYNVDLRVGLHVNADLNSVNPYSDSAYSNDQYAYNRAFSYTNDIVKHIPKPDNFTTTTVFNNRIYWTPVKINGSPVDNWSSLPVDNYYDLSSNYGSINTLIGLGNNLYALQDNAISVLLINQTALISDQNSQPLQLGTGQTLQRHNHISTSVGTKHQWSVAASPTSISFVDTLRKKLYLFDGQQLKPISDIEGHRGFMNKVFNGKIITNDNPLLGYGVLTNYDYKNNEFLYTFLNKVAYGEEAEVNDKYTLVYSDLINKFTSFYDFTPYMYINNKINYYSLPDYSTGAYTKLYMHNKGNYCKFYDTVYPSTLKTVVNDNPLYTKVFDSLAWSTVSIKDTPYVYVDDINDYIAEDNNIPYLNDTFDSVRCYNEYENTDWTNLVVTGANRNLKKTEQTFKFQIPRNKVNYDTTNINTTSIFDPAVLTKTSFGERLRDKYMIVDLTYPNTNNNRFTVNNLKTNYRPSYR